MKLRHFIIPILSSVLLISCSQSSKTEVTAAVKLKTEAGTHLPATRMIERRQLGITGFHNLNDFILPDVRERLDREPAGANDGESSFVPPVDVQSGGEVTDPEPVNAEPEENAEYSEENPLKEQEIDKVKFSWVKKKFGDELSADPNLNGVIVLYADENFYDLNRLTDFVNEGRYRLAANSDIDPARVQVVFGGYRSAAQVELWVVPHGENMPELKPEERFPKRSAED